MPSSSPSPTGSGFGRAVSRAIALLLGLVLALSGFILMVGALLVGLALAAGLTLWALLRGRRPPPVQFRWRGGMARGTRAGQAAPPRAQGEVVDVQVREIPDRPEP